MNDNATIDLKTLLQLVGRLEDSDDPGSASQRFRAFLEKSVVGSVVLREYVDACLADSGDQLNKALQDIVNHTGRLLGFEVQFGRYRGQQGQPGHDGLWRSPKGRYVVVEIKTSDTYTVRTDTLLGYINRLISDRVIADQSVALGLYVYGRPSAEVTQLEDAIIAQKGQNELRVISVEALLSLLELVQDYDLDHDSVLDLLLPHHVRIDHLVSLIYGLIGQERDKPAERPTPPSIADRIIRETATATSTTTNYYLLPANDSEDGTRVDASRHDIV